MADTERKLHEVPRFPLTIVWEDGDTWVMDSVSDLEQNLEWFDSKECPGVQIHDARRRKVSLCIDGFRLDRLILDRSNEA
jgi:hypothetical protein